MDERILKLEVDHVNSVHNTVSVRVGGKTQSEFGQLQKQFRRASWIERINHVVRNSYR